MTYLFNAGASLSDSCYRGFAAEAPVNALQSLSTQSTEYKPEIEEDKVVTANGDYLGEEHTF